MLELGRRLATRLIPSIISGLFVVVAVFQAPTQLQPLAEALSDGTEVTVWGITHTKVYHCPGSRWYGKTKEGKFLGECQAIRDKYRPYLGRGCGSRCD